jgi:hypothetical protein
LQLYICGQKLKLWEAAERLWDVEGETLAEEKKKDDNQQVELTFFRLPKCLS